MPGLFFRDFTGSYRSTARAFPLAGVVIALLPALAVFAGACLSVSPILLALIGIGLQVLLTGGLHEDGIADAADGLGGSRTRERALEIMRDSRVGTYGVLALIFSIGLRSAALSTLLQGKSPSGAALAVIAIAAMSRAAMVLHWHVLPPARTDGVAAQSGRPDGGAAIVALASALLIFFLLTWPAFGFGASLFALALCTPSVWWFGRFALKKLGGHTGDTIGATQQIAEIALYTGLALVTQVTPSSLDIG